MGLELILVIITFLVGIMVLLFASRIGEWWFSFYSELRRELPDSISKYMFFPFTSPLFFILLFRIIGIFFIGGPVFILYMELFA